jgi:hypothetical protein
VNTWLTTYCIYRRETSYTLLYTKRNRGRDEKGREWKKNISFTLLHVAHMTSKG